jgi:Cu(I)/Ag(I) efflux system membrane fusion protein
VVVAANFLIDAESNLKASVGGLGGHAGHGASVPAQATPDEPKRAAKAGGVGHHAEGSVESIDAKAGTLSLNHGAVASLKWPAMTMEFAVANASLLKGLKPGTQVAFDFVERQPGEWVITAIAPLAGQAPANPHAGH